MAFNLSDHTRSKEHQNLSGKLRPSGRFSFAQVFPKKKKMLNDAKEITGYKSPVQSVSELDERYKRISSGGGVILHEVLDSLEQEVQGVGLSIAVNSRKRAERGSKGITSPARDILCWSANQLERVYRRANMSFLTLTLPELSQDDLVTVQSNWPKIVKGVTEEIKRALERSGLSTAIVGCVELQLERGANDGRDWPHLHMVFRGRHHSKSQWALSAKGFRKIWRGVLGRVVSTDIYDWSACENVQQVAKSSGGYLAKYISKGKSKGQDEIRDTWHPSDWIICSRRLRSLYKRLSITGYDIAVTLANVCDNWSPGMGYKSYVIISTAKGSSLLTDDWADQDLKRERNKPVYGERIIGQWGWLRGEEKFLTPMEWFALVD